MKRRDFIKVLAGGSAALLSMPPLFAGTRDRLGLSLSRRLLGASGEKVTILGLGGFHIGWTTEDLAKATIETALESGIRFFDTAEGYANGLSEERFGRYLTPQFRKEIFLMTKTQAKTAGMAREHLAASLDRLKTDVIDLWQLHALQSVEDVDERLSAGVLEVAMEARASGKVRHIGFTGHACPYAQKRILELAGSDFSACQMPINPVDFSHPHSFTRGVAPGAIGRGLGVIAMKTLADGRFFAEKQQLERSVWSTADPIIPDTLTISDCTVFALSQPVSTLVVGAEKPEFVKDKVAIARAFEKLPPEALESLSAKVARFAKSGDIEYYKRAELRKVDD